MAAGSRQSLVLTFPGTALQDLAAEYADLRAKVGAAEQNCCTDRLQLPKDQGPFEGNCGARRQRGYGRHDY